MKKRILAFTDLDGTLLDHETYSFAAARPAVRRLRRESIPLIICSSKTRAEIEVVRAALNNRDPFIVENGGAVFIPKAYFHQELPSAKKGSRYDILEIGTSYTRLLQVLTQIKEKLPGKLIGFSDLPVKDIAELTGLSVRDAALAKKREYDEPFLLADPGFLQTTLEMATAAGLNITQGGRFFHLTGDNDKGKAVRLLQTIYEEEAHRSLKSIGLGDSANDLPLLEAVNFPVLVQKPGGRYDPSIRLEKLYYAPGEGPVGWRAAVLDLVERLAG
jgi:mannosyl-3-phosphoglycerate phosphatase